MPVEHAEGHVEKRLSSREKREPEAVERLRSEARLLARLSGLGITPKLLASGEDARGPWHRIERIGLPTLAERLAAAGGALAPAWIERAVKATFGALAILHEASDAGGPLLVVHADLSPANIAIDDAGSRAVVLDLDLASWREGPARNDGAFRGTLGYVAPEVARGERPTRQSDLFALAAALFHGVTGAPPRSGPSFAALLAVAAEAPLLRDEHADLADRGRGHAALLTCLAHDPARRPASARDVVAAVTG
jgi:eukaryotic-like serine/threonine-protein kinase